MKNSRYSPEQVAFGLRQAGEGTPVAEVCRKTGISEQTFYRWKKRFQGMGVAAVRRLRVLEEENRKLKQLVAHPVFGQADAPGRAQKKTLKPAHLPRSGTGGWTGAGSATATGASTSSSSGRAGL